MHGYVYDAPGNKTEAVCCLDKSTVYPKHFHSNGNHLLPEFSLLVPKLGMFLRFAIHIQLRLTQMLAQQACGKTLRMKECFGCSYNSSK
jgi:hypothetical protein